MDLRKNNSYKLLIFYVVTLHLTIINIDVSTTVDGGTIIANNNEASYQWLDCDNNFNPLPTETNQDFSAGVDGNYAVELVQGDCRDISQCINTNASYLEHKDAS